jgi:hypothetical protein
LSHCDLGASWRQQREFFFVNFQALPFLETTFRLSNRLNGTTGRGTTTDRAFDLKLRVWEENAWRPALAIGLNWKGATRAGAMASIVTGLVITLGLESLAFFKVFTFPAGVTATAIALVLSMLVFFVVSWLTRHTAAATLAPDVCAVMDA